MEATLQLGPATAAVVATASSRTRQLVGLIPGTEIEAGHDPRRHNSSAAARRVGERAPLAGDGEDQPRGGLVRTNRWHFGFARLPRLLPRPDVAVWIFGARKRPPAASRRGPLCLSRLDGRSADGGQPQRAALG